MGGIALLSLVPSTILASPVAETGNIDIPQLFFVLGILLLVGKFSGELSERVGQPAVLGELVAGAILGGGALGVIPTGPGDPLTEIVKVFAEVGVVILLFEIGLETDLKELFRVGPGALAVALVGVTLPLAGGVLFWISPLANRDFAPASIENTAIFLGAALTATSVGITARVLQDLRVMRSVESRLIIGAAVIDDVMGLILLGLVSSLAAGQSVTALGVGRSIAAAVGFLVIAVGVGMVSAPKIFDLFNRMRVRGVLLVIAFAFTLIVAALADKLGSAMIIGAFAAGLILSGTNQFDLIADRTKPVADIFTPIFFLSIGAEFDVRLLNPFQAENLPVLELGGILLVIAIVGKLAAGWAVPWRRYNRLAVGVGMMPRGEVGLIFASLGLATGVLSRELFGSIIIMVIGTTFLAPPILKWVFIRYGVTGPGRDGPAVLVRKKVEATDGTT
ncbi:MAG: cation:proton antiporter [Gemmatimonadales bacterium]